jgi:hypothetical protein
MIYAGYTGSKLTDKLTRGKHEALVSEEIIRKNIEILDGTSTTYNLHGDDLYPLRGTLLCANCGLKLTASAPRGNGGFYSSYACGRKTCARKVTGKRASQDSDIVHKHFRKLLEAQKPLDCIASYTRKYCYGLGTLSTAMPLIMPSELTEKLNAIRTYASKLTASSLKTKLRKRTRKPSLSPLILNSWS